MAQFLAIDAMLGGDRTVAAHLVAPINGLSAVGFQTGRQYSRARDLEAIFLAIAFETGS